jgi:ferric-dicitrate binding protein FerR (iron transport regulator)
MNRRAFYHLLQRYLDGNCTDEEKTLVEQWYELLDDDHDAVIGEEEIRDTVQRLWPAIKDKTLPLPAAMPAGGSVKRMPRYIKWMSAAAAVAAIAWGAWSFVVQKGYFNTAGEKYGVNLKQQINQQASADTVYLPDQSMVILEPHAKIYYPDSFAHSKREVYLEGNAFFKVTRNPARPFYVYSNNIVTQVLGTSFFVKTNQETNDVEVSVCTGKVAVYENEEQAKKNKRGQESTGVILKPNQKVIYNRDDHHFRTTLVDMPLPLVPDSQQEEKVAVLNFEFEETPIAKVLGHLESAYHIEILLENDNLGKCLFSGDIKGQNIYDQLEIICQSVQASYEIRGTRILVKGNPDD